MYYGWKTVGWRLAGYCSVLCFCRIFYILFLKQLGSNAVFVSCQVGRTEVEIWTFLLFLFFNSGGDDVEADLKCRVSTTL